MVQALFFFLFLSLFFSAFTVRLPDTGAEPPYQHRASSCVTNLGSIVLHCLPTYCISVSLSVLKRKGKSASVKIELRSQSSHFITRIQIVFYRWLVWMRWRWLSEQGRRTVIWFLPLSDKAEHCHWSSSLAQSKLIKGKQKTKSQVDGSEFWLHSAVSSLGDRCLLWNDLQYLPECFYLAMMLIMIANIVTLVLKLCLKHMTYIIS